MTLNEKDTASASRICSRETPAASAARMLSASTACASVSLRSMRNLARSLEGAIIQVCGCRTRSMLDRYNIFDEADLAAAGAKRFGNGKQAANMEPSTAPPIP